MFIEKLRNCSSILQYHCLKLKLIVDCIHLSTQFMKIGFDISMITKDKAGIGYYASELLSELILKSPHDYYLFTNSIENIPEKFLKENIVVIEKSKPGFSWIFKVAKYSRKNKLDYFISPSNLAFGFLLKNTIQIVHDLSPVKYPNFFGRVGAFKYRLLLILALKRSKYIATNSDTTKQDIITFFRVKNSSKIQTIGIGLNPWVFDKSDSQKDIEVSKKYNLPKNFILSLSTLEPRKNHTNMIRAFSLIAKENKDLHYVIAGKKGWLYDEIFTLVKDLGMEERIHFIGYVDEEDLASLIDLSKLLLYVSIWEGVGMPPLEAYARNKPVVVSDITVFKEFLENRAIFVKNDDIKDIKRGITEALNVKVKSDEKLFGTYSWKNVSENVLKLMK